ncbi:peptidoglycan-N-acetylmuramate O-acetyltransferase [Coriobacterium glomerans PW2]|uniref:Peptidoglycan-N-acetylmuramate O-acetyltransferase n=1 Tax=Coriobacterium glomerans (strain ATCC 49209 / DSM 20642 / JCM 10262 / PW2) TaxID=700015 RepID=F2NA00_CORGP|nr:acyltransferase family protein [Coriobacterium glomerans]AEB06255.1 peptidoglycan-N-acetylmuramate O-acetyltransferase [Coriobacterium glomerans PW2]
MERTRGIDSRAKTVSGTRAGASVIKPDSTSAAHRSRYIPALDGIRTLAVLAVILYHLNLPWAQGGMLGVTVFFVLSGYLITRLLLSEYAGTGQIDLPRFWLRRIRRLVPAIATVIVVTIALCTAFNHVMLTKMRPDILPSLLFFNNWWQIAHNISYFNALGDPSPLTHFWSLAIEEQFYLVWPPLLLIMLRLGVSRRIIRRMVLCLSLVSAVAMIALYNPSVDPSRVYYGTDTRAFSLLLGAWLAFLPETEMRFTGLLRALHLIRKRGDGRSAHEAPRVRTQATRRDGMLDLMGLASLAGLAFMLAYTNGYTAFQYRGGTLLCSVLAVALIAACAQPKSLLGACLSLSPLVWIGKRSYGIYLWHFPLLVLMNPSSSIEAAPWWLMVAQVCVVIAAAQISYRLIETPFRIGAFGSLVRELRCGALSLPEWGHAHAPMLAAAGLTLLVAVGGVAFVPNTSALSDEGAAALDAPAEADGAPPPEAANNPSGGAAEDADGFPVGAYDVLMIGDSVSLRCVPQFQQRFPHGHIDAAKNRRFEVGTTQYESYVAQKLAGKIAVFALGTNGLVSDEQIDALMSDVGKDRVVVFVNTRSRQPWVAPTNEAISKARERYPNVRVIDWFGYSAGKGDLFDGDGTHLSEAGAKAYVDLVYDQIKGDLPAHEEDLASDPSYAAAKDALDAFGTELAEP